MKAIKISEHKFESLVGVAQAHECSAVYGHDEIHGDFMVTRDDDGHIVAVQIRGTEIVFWRD